MIPEKTTLEERLKFYEYALVNIKIKGSTGFICHLAEKFLNDDEFYDEFDFEPKNLLVLYPELYASRLRVPLYPGQLWNSNNDRIEALKQAIIAVKEKISQEQFDNERGSVGL